MEPLRSGRHIVLNFKVDFIYIHIHRYAYIYTFYFDLNNSHPAKKSSPTGLRLSCSPNQRPLHAG